MSTDLYFDAVIPPDEKWQRMKKVYDVCKESKIDPPDEVSNYFNGDEPDPTDRIVSLGERGDNPAIKEYTSHHYGGYEIDLSKLPPGTKSIRVKWG